MAENDMNKIEGRKQTSACLLTGISLLLLIMGRTLPGENGISLFARSLSCPLFFFSLGFLIKPSESLHHYAEILKYAFIRIGLPIILIKGFRIISLYFKELRNGAVPFSDYLAQLKQTILYSQEIGLDAPVILCLLTALCLILFLYHLIYLTSRNDYVSLAISVILGAAGFVLVRRGTELPFSVIPALIGLLYYAAGTCFQKRVFCRNIYTLLILVVSSVLFIFILPGQMMDMTAHDYPHKFIFLKMLCGCMAFGAGCSLLADFFPSLSCLLSFTGKYPISFILVHYTDYLFKDWFTFPSYPGLSFIIRWMIIFAVSAGISYCFHALSATSAADLSVRDFYRRHKPVTDVFFYILFAAAYTWLFFQTTMFRSYFAGIPGNTLNTDINRIITAMFIVLAMFTLFDCSSKKQLIILLSIMVIGTMHYYYAGTHKFFLLCFIITAITNRDFKPLPYISYIIGSAIMILCYLASRAGYLHYLTYAPASHSFGIIYRTDHAAHVLFLMMSYLVMRENKLYPAEYALQILAAYFTWHYTAGKLSVICMIVLLAGSAVLQFQERNNKIIKIPESISFIHVFCCLFTFLAVFLYSKGFLHFGAETLSTFLSRYHFSSLAFQNYPIRLFGTNIIERGSDGLSIYSSREYFAIDIMYVKLILRYGLLSLLMYLYIMTKCTLRSVRKHNQLLVLIFVVLAVNAMVEHHAIEYCYNIFILLPFVKQGNKEDNGI